MIPTWATVSARGHPSAAASDSCGTIAPECPPPSLYSVNSAALALSVRCSVSNPTSRLYVVRPGEQNLPRLSQVFGKKVRDQVRALGVEELFAAMAAAVEDDRAAGELERLVAALELEGLVHRGLRVLVAVDQQQRGVAGVDVEHGAGQAREVRRLVRLRAQQQLKGGDANAEPVRRRLGEDGRQVG